MIILGLIEYIAIVLGSYGLSFLKMPMFLIRAHVEGTQIIEDAMEELVKNSEFFAKIFKR